MTTYAALIAQIAVDAVVLFRHLTDLTYPFSIGIIARICAGGAGGAVGNPCQGWSGAGMVPFAPLKDINKRMGQPLIIGERGCCLFWLHRVGQKVPVDQTKRHR